MFKFLSNLFTIREIPLPASYSLDDWRMIRRDLKSIYTHIKSSEKVGITREERKHHLNTAKGLSLSVHKRIADFIVSLNS